MIALPVLYFMAEVSSYRGGGYGIFSKGILRCKTEDGLCVLGIIMSALLTMAGVEIHAHMWRSVLTCGGPCSHVKVRAHMWRSVLTCGDPCSRVEIRAHVWRSVLTCGDPCSHVEIHAYMCSKGSNDCLDA